MSFGPSPFVLGIPIRYRYTIHARLGCKTHRCKVHIQLVSKSTGFEPESR